MMLIALLLAASAVPRANLDGLNDAQQKTFLQVATDVYNYAGCDGTLAKCLQEGESDTHALRMAALVKQLIAEGAPADAITQLVEKYYASFAPRERQQFNLQNCATLGPARAPVTLVEFSDFQCPHCAAAAQPLHDLVEDARKGKVRLASKEFPLQFHPRARIAAACAEYARTRNKYWPFAVLVFTHQETLEDANLKEFAQQAGLSGDEMLKEVYAGKFDGIVEKHIREGLAAGVDSTPSVFVDGRRNQLPMRPWYLQFTVDDELEWQKEKGWHYGAHPAVAKGK